MVRARARAGVRARARARVRRLWARVRRTWARVSVKFKVRVTVRVRVVKLYLSVQDPRYAISRGREGTKRE